VQGVQVISRMASGTARLVLAKGLSICLGFATGPIIARLFSAEDMGSAGIIYAASAWIAVVGCLSYDQAIPLSVDAGEMRAIIRLCLVLAAIVFLATVLGSMGAKGLGTLLGWGDVRRLVWFVPPTVLATCLVSIGYFAASRGGRYSLVSISGFVGANLTRILLIGMGLLFGSSAVAVLLAGVLGTASEVLITGLVFIPLVLAGADTRSHSVPLRVVAVRYRQFPAMQLWNNVLDASARSLPVFLLGGLFGAQVVGFYVFGYRLLSLPISLLGQSLAQVFYPEASAEWNRTGAVTHTAFSSISILSILFVFPTLMLILLAPLMFTFLFGENWYEAGVYAQILAPVIGVQLVVSPISSIFLIRRRAGLLFRYTVALLVGQSCGLLLGAWLGGARIGLALLSVCSSATYCHMLVSALKLGEVPWGPILASMTKQALVSLAVLLPASIAYWVLDLRELTLVAFASGALLYAFSLYHTEARIRRIVRQPFARIWAQTI